MPISSIPGAQMIINSHVAESSTRVTSILALNRIVTGLSDLGRRTEPGQSMSEVARTMGLPKCADYQGIRRLFVAIR